MAESRKRTPRKGRPRTKSGLQKSVMFRWPSTFVEQLHQLAADEERSINTTVFRLLREAITARGQQVAVSESAVDTSYGVP